MRTFLPDVNFWMALTFEGHAHHAPATQWFTAESPAECIFCRLTQRGLLRLGTNLAAAGKDALTMDGAWGAYDRLFDDPRIGFADEPEDIERAWRSFTQRQAVLSQGLE
jgi:predicted nucleic acid-binding protein